MRDVLALIGFQGMVNEIILGVLDPLLLNTTAKVETFHPLCSCRPILLDISVVHIQVRLWTKTRMRLWAERHTVRSDVHLSPGQVG